jgi:endonuclease/exonuclease/phosphatase (EEP) superfamily protein YafD
MRIKVPARNLFPIWQDSSSRKNRIWNEKRLRLVEEIVGELKLTEVMDFPEGRTTGDMESDFFNSIFGIQNELPLDRVYYQGFSVDSARVLPYESSDHKPIAVRLTLN